MGPQQPVRNPVLFVRGTASTITTVDIVPEFNSNLDPKKFEIVGTVMGSIQSGPNIISAVPSGLQFTAFGGELVGKDWVFQNLTANKQFDTVAYIPDLSISWKVVRIANTVDSMTSGDSDNPAYLTFEAVKPNPNADFKMLRTLLQIGCVAGGGGIAPSGDIIPMTKDGITLAIWDAFKPLNIQTWDGIPLVYYQSWDYKTNTDNATTAGLIKSHDGDCTAFSRMLIDTLRAQGIENTDDLYVMVPEKVDVFTALDPMKKSFTVPQLMFINNWQAIPKGTEIIKDSNVPAKYVWAWTDAVPPQQNTWLSVPNGPENAYQYNWDPAFSEVTKTRDSVAGQNNKNPQSIFDSHVAVQLTINGITKLYDPSYGAEYADMADFQNKAIGYFAVSAFNVSFVKNGPIYSQIYYIRAKTADLNLDRLIVRGATDY